MGFFGLFNKSKPTPKSGKEQGQQPTVTTAPRKATAATKTPEGTPHCADEAALKAEHIRHFLPIRLLPARVVDYLARQATLTSHPAGSAVNATANGTEKTAVYLIQGELEFKDPGGARRISSSDAKATFPLDLDGHIGQIVATQRTLLAHFPVDLIRGAENVSPDGKTYGTLKSEPSFVEPALFIELIDEARAGTLELPSPPDLGVRIGRAIDRPEATSENIARIIQLDPALTARLIQVANSPLYSGLGKISNCSTAVTRLGLATTRNLVISFLLKNLFHNKSVVLQHAMDRLWKNSTRVAAISSVLAKLTPRLEPGRAMLAGLVHEIGAIAVINDAKRHPDLMDNEQYLWEAVDRLSAEIGAIIMEQWNFGDDLVDVVKNASNWMRDETDLPTYTDLVMIAKLHARVGTMPNKEFPRLDLVPAFHKMALGKLSPRLSLVILDQSEKDIHDVQALLN